MAINRAPFNLLQDDDGSNTVGSIWNKAAIASTILDPVDAAITGAWTPIAHNAGMYTASAGAWTVSAANQVTLSYRVDGSTAFVVLSLDSTTISASAVRLFVTFPAGVPLPAAVVNVPVTYYGTGGSVVGTGFVEILTANAKVGLLRDIAGTTWPVGQIFVRGEWFYPI